MADSAVVQTKVCSKCGSAKSFECFGRRARAIDGLQAWCSACMTVQNRDWAQANKQKANGYAAKYRAANREKMVAATAKWSAANRDKVNLRDRLRYASPKGNIEANMGRSIRQSLLHGKNGRHWETLVGYTVEDLMAHLEGRFLDGMTWENRSEWHIDHIIPKSVFNYDSPEHADFKRCWALENLQPLWAKENIKKSDKLSAPFQPSLAF